MNIYQSIKNFGDKALLVGGLVAVLIGCDNSQKGIGQMRIIQIVDDFNNDKRSDLAFLTFDEDQKPETKGYNGSLDFYISLGQEDGTFSKEKKAFHFELKPENLLVGDVNGDGNKDLLFIAGDKDADPKTRGYDKSFDQYVALGNGDGTFQDPKKVEHYDAIPFLD